jgi:hypothetical protein
MIPFGDNFIPVIPVDYAIHSPHIPFCYNDRCPCHEDRDNIAQVHQYYLAGELTAQEATDTVNGKMLGG